MDKRFFIFLFVFCVFTSSISAYTGYNYVRQDDNKSVLYINISNPTNASFTGVKTFYITQGAGAYAQNNNKVFPLYDNFSGASINTSKWTCAVSCPITNGLINGSFQSVLNNFNSGEWVIIGRQKITHTTTNSYYLGIADGYAFLAGYAAYRTSSASPNKWLYEVSGGGSGSFTPNYITGSSFQKLQILLNSTSGTQFTINLNDTKKTGLPAGTATKIVSGYNGGDAIYVLTDYIGAYQYKNPSKVIVTTTYNSVGNYWKIKINNSIGTDLSKWVANVSISFTTGNLKISDVIPTIGNYSVSAISNIDSSSINSFSILVQNKTKSFNKYTSSGNALTNINVTNSKKRYNVTCYNMSNYVSTTYLNYNFSLSGDLTCAVYPKNIIIINTFSQNGSRLNQNFTVKLIGSSPVILNTYYTNNKTLILRNVSNNNYTLEIYNLNYAQQTYYFTMNNSNYNLNVYFPYQNKEVKVFTFQNTQNIPQENCLASFTKLINSSYVSVGQILSDSAGTGQITLDNYQTYKIFVTCNLYLPKTYTINTIPNSLMSSNGLYTIILLSSAQTNFTDVNDYFYYSYLPTNNIISTHGAFKINLTTVSVLGMIQNFGVYLNSTLRTNISGSPSGGVANLNLNTNQFTNGAQIPIKFFIVLTNGQIFYYTVPFYYNYINQSNVNSNNEFNNYNSSVNHDQYTNVLLACFIISFLCLFLSPIFPQDNFDGSKKGVNILMIGGIALFTGLGWLPIILSILTSLVLFLDLFGGQ